MAIYNNTSYINDDDDDNENNNLYVTSFNNQDFYILAGWM